jgi:hypothetical protein
MGFRPACLTNRTHIRTLLLGSGRVGFGLDDLVVTSPAGVRPQRPMSDPPRSEKASEAGPFPLPACAPVRSAGCVGSHGPPGLVPVSARRRPPLPTCRVCSHARRPRASVQRRLTEHNGHGWMDHGWMRPSKIPGRSRVVTGHAAVTCVLRGVGGGGGSGSPRPAVGQRHGMPPNGAGIPRPHGSARQFAGDRWMSRLFWSSGEDTPRGATQPVTPRFCQSRPKRSDTMFI